MRSRSLTPTAGSPLTLPGTPLRSTYPASSPSAGARLKAHRPRARVATALRTAVPVVTPPRPEQRTPRREERQSQARRYGPGAGFVPGTRHPLAGSRPALGVSHARNERLGPDTRTYLITHTEYRKDSSRPAASKRAKRGRQDPCAPTDVSRNTVPSGTASRPERATEPHTDRHPAPPEACRSTSKAPAGRRSPRQGARPRPAGSHAPAPSCR